MEDRLLILEQQVKELQEIVKHQNEMLMKLTQTTTEGFERLSGAQIWDIIK